MTAQLPDLPAVASPVDAPAESDMVSVFRERALSVSAVVHGPVSRHGAPRAVAGIASGHDAESFMAWDDLPVNGVPSALSALGLARIDADIPWSPDRASHLARYQGLGIGVTGADAGLAESGSLVLTHGPGRPRMASLVPDVHIALLEVRLMVPSLAQWAQQNRRIPADTANLVIVTGPSRTGDIEMQLNLGVHGPRHLHVVLVS
jgi:L-lactate dehydrogenase complex protein LldG